MPEVDEEEEEEKEQGIETWWLRQIAASLGPPICNRYP